MLNIGLIIKKLLITGMLERRSLFKGVLVFGLTLLAPFILNLSGGGGIVRQGG